MTIKLTNPKDALGIVKTPVSTVPCQVIMEVGVAMLEGAAKYGRHNYRASGVRVSVYYDAAMRHLMAWWEGEDIDPDSGLSHVTKAISSLVVLRDAMFQNTAVYDRPPRGNPEWMQELNKSTKQILDKHPDPAEPFTSSNCTIATK